MIEKVHSTHLNQSVFPEQWAGESGCRPKKSRICHFLYSLPDGKYQSGVHKRHNDVGIKLI